MNHTGRKIIRRLVRNFTPPNRRHPRKRKNGEIVLLCPFHTEKTPSFHVNNINGSYYCFGCHKKGTVYKLAKEHPELLGRMQVWYTIGRFPATDDDIPF